MTESKTAEEALAGYLRQGERIRWQSGTKPFPLLEKREGGIIIGKWIGTAVVTIALLTLYIGHVPEWNAKVAAAILLIAALLALSPVVERWSLLGQRYWITDQRAILLTRDRSFYAMELSELDDFWLLPGRTAGDCLVLGSCLFEEGERQLRWRACHPKTDLGSDGGRDLAQGLVFFSVEDGTAAAECLCRT